MLSVKFEFDIKKQPAFRQTVFLWRNHYLSIYGPHNLCVIVEVVFCTAGIADGTAFGGCIAVDVTAVEIGL